MPNYHSSWDLEKESRGPQTCVGLLVSVIAGMAMVNFAARKGWAKESRMKTATNKLSLQGINAMDDRPVAGFQTVSADSIDVLAWHLTVLALAMGIGWSFQSLIAIAGGPDLPLFVLSMIGGIMIQRFLQAFNTKMSELAEFMRAKGLPTSVSERITGFYEHMYQRKTLFDERQIIEELPPPIQKDLVRHLCASPYISGTGALDSL